MGAVLEAREWEAGRLALLLPPPPPLPPAPAAAPRFAPGEANCAIRPGWCGCEDPTRPAA